MASRRLPVGAEVLPAGGVDFRVWAPRRKRVAVEVEGAAPQPLAADGKGYFSGTLREAQAGSRYRYRLDGAGAFPDPASRFQPEGPHGPSQVVNPARYRWSDSAWRGAPLAGQVVYEMHIGTFTREGTWAAAARELAELAAAGITVVEVMPVAEFSGRFGWGYDGVDLFAPAHLYGTPDELRAFVDRAHAAGVAVILDVVYNHCGPDGCYLRDFSRDYFTSRYENEWGEPINFDGANCAPVRELYIANAGYWVDEFHMDGLRLDATQQIFDDSPVHIIREVTEAVRRAARGRSTLVVAENERQEARLARSIEQGGYGVDALWNDDFHHSAHVAVTGQSPAYYSDYHGAPQELVSAVKRGFLFQGQRYAWQKQARGTAAMDLPRAAFVNFLQNHDQVANSATGERIHQLASPGRLRAITALTLLAPGTPMLFQGQEFGASSPFLYFADHPPELAAAVQKGRAEFMRQFPGIDAERLPAPHDPRTFERCKLDFAERGRNAPVYALHRDLLRLRREDAVFGTQPPVDGAVIAAEALALRFFAPAGDERLLVVNLGRELHLVPAPEPLLAAPGGKRWGVLWSSEDARYGGGGTDAGEKEDGWRIPAHSAVAFHPETAR